MLFNLSYDGYADEGTNLGTESASNHAYLCWKVEFLNVQVINVRLPSDNIQHLFSDNRQVCSTCSREFFLAVVPSP